MKFSIGPFSFEFSYNVKKEGSKFSSFFPSWRDKDYIIEDRSQSVTGFAPPETRRPLTDFNDILEAREKKRRKADKPIVNVRP